MAEALGLVEYETISAGFRAADTIAKTAEVRLLRAQVICPGKYVLLFAGEIGAVKAVLDAARANHAERLLDSFLLGNPHPQVTDALESAARRDADTPCGAALGTVEVSTVAAAVVAADMAAKAAGVQILELRLEREVANKAYVLMRGTVSEVTEAVHCAARRAEEAGTLLDSAVLPNPDEKFWKTLL